MENLPINFDKFVSPFGGSVRVIMIDGEPWFFAKDICDCLDLGNVGQTVNCLDEDERKTLDSNIINNDVGSNGGRAPLIVSETGMYSLVLKSRKPEAKKFKRWITHEVLPSLRKTGMYGGPRTLQESLRAYADLLDVNEQNRRLALETQAKVAELAYGIIVTEAQRDKAIKEKAWINSSRSGRCLRKVRTANEEKRKVEAENNELKIQLGNSTNWKTVAAMQKELEEFFYLNNEARKEIGKCMVFVSKKTGMEIKKIEDARYGCINTYHRDAWKIFFHSISLPENATFLAKYKKSL